MKKSTQIFNRLIELILDVLMIKKDSWRREKAYYFLSSLILIPLNFLRGKRRISKNVETQYDQISGSYIQDNYYVDNKRYCIVDGRVKFISSIENMKNIRLECNKVLSELDFSTLLEVGVGELTTIESIVSNNDQLTEVYGVDLSINRMLDGIREYKKRQTLLPKLSKSNATNLPFNDAVFDLVYSRHTLEQMPLIFEEALDEMLRVSRKYVVLFEPSFEKGSLTQKLKMIRNDYFRGLDKYLSNRSDIHIRKSYLMNNSANPLNRTSCYVLEKAKQNQEESDINFVCPVSKEKLDDLGSFFYSPISQLAYPKINKIPVLDAEQSYFLFEKNIK
ncbi:MAG: hypothetical protein CMD35_01260 [Flavobacteriales bacterium]|nr:hypothetical protein [Flavobacteriales bacterium]|tara:strand:+ start:556 stop:1557 length:1002 start_codon:yes stop_codon:yes gene_type:complete